MYYWPSDSLWKYVNEQTFLPGRQPTLPVPDSSKLEQWAVAMTAHVVSSSTARNFDKTLTGTEEMVAQLLSEFAGSNAFGVGRTYFKEWCGRERERRDPGEGGGGRT